MANLANLENQQINRDFWYPFKKNLRTAKMAKLENQQINVVLGIWYIGELGNMENQQINRDFWYPFKKF